MPLLTRTGVFFGVMLLLAPLDAATSRQDAASFSRKVDQIRTRAEGRQAPGARTPVSENELNSWFTYTATPLIPAGVTGAQITMIGNGKLSGQAIVDLDAIAKRRSSGGTFDIWNLVGGKVPVTVAGTLNTANGVGTFALESAQISGIPVPKAVLQELVSHYSRTPTHPDGVELDDSFALPAAIRQIDVGAGQAVVVQ